MGTIRLKGIAEFPKKVLEEGGGGWGSEHSCKLDKDKSTGKVS
jgi:hypothetical protein